VVPAWKVTFGISTPAPVAIYLVMVAYSAANYVFVERPRAGAWLTFVTLCLDLFVLVYLVVISGGLKSPLLPTQLLFTMLFVMLFPHPLAVMPPLLIFPIVAKIQQLLNDGEFESDDLFFLVWYTAVNTIVIYVIVYLNWRDELKHKEIVRLERNLASMAVVEERTRLAREIHDGLGGTLSSLIIQAEYLQGLAQDEAMRGEIGELKGQAEESIEELRRSLKMMHDDFDLVRAVQEVCRKFEARTHGLGVTFRQDGREREVASDVALTLFRVLQESLANVAKHAQASHVSVVLAFSDEACSLTVRDDGRGFDATQPPPIGHYGLLNMGERAMRSGGVSKVESAPGQGTTVSLSVPVAADTRKTAAA